MHRCGPPFLDLSKIPNIYSVPLNDEDQDSWQEFKKFDDGTPTLYAITSSLAAQHKRPLQLEHPFVCVVGEFAIASFNKACEMHVKKGNHNNIYDYEFMECKYLKFTRDYVFSMTIEAIEEGKIGVYEAKVSCNIIDGRRRSLIKFFLTDRTPVGERAMATNVKSIYNTLKGLKKDIEIYLETTRTCMKEVEVVSTPLHICGAPFSHKPGSSQKDKKKDKAAAELFSMKIHRYKAMYLFTKWSRMYQACGKNGKAAAKSKKHHQKAMNGEKKDKVAAKLIRLKKHHNKVIEGLCNVLVQEQWYPFQQDFNQRANQDVWMGDIYFKSGMELRKKGATCRGYDYRNPMGGMSGFYCIW